MCFSLNSIWKRAKFKWKRAKVRWKRVKVRQKIAKVRWKRAKVRWKRVKVRQKIAKVRWKRAEVSGFWSLDSGSEERFPLFFLSPLLSLCGVPGYIFRCKI